MSELKNEKPGLHLRNRLLLLSAVVLGGTLLTAVLLFALPRYAARPAATITPPPPASPAPQQPVVAAVDDQAVYLDEWQKAVALDTVLNALAGQPNPGAETTLDRLINERLVLRAAAGLSASDAQAQARLAALQQTWGADDAAVARALASAGISRPALLEEIKRLLVVEACLQKISASQDATLWLTAQRARARISIYVDLPVTAGAVTTPTAVAQAMTPATAPTTPAAEIGPAVGQLAPDFTLNAMDGKTIKLSDLRGQPVVVNLWATWCPVCRSELPALQAAYQHYRAAGVILLGVDVKEDAETVRQFAAQNGLTFPILLDGDGAVAQAYQARGIPTTVFVDAQGVVRARQVGPLTEEKFAEYIEPLLTPPTPAPTPTLQADTKSAPDFSLPRDDGSTVTLSHYRDKASVVLVFYRGQT